MHLPYIPIELNIKGGSALTLNAVAVTGVYQVYSGTSLTTYVRTLDGCEWGVKETPEQVREIMRAAFTVVNGVPQDVKPLEVARKGRGGK